MARSFTVSRTDDKGRRQLAFNLPDANVTLQLLRGTAVEDRALIVSVSLASSPQVSVELDHEELEAVRRFLEID